MFLFSGTFFPISQLPTWLQAVAYVTPLYHGVALCRDLTLGQVGWADLGHAAYLCALRRRSATPRAGGPSPRRLVV